MAVIEYNFFIRYNARLIFVYVAAVQSFYVCFNRNHLLDDKQLATNFDLI